MIKNNFFLFLFILIFINKSLCANNIGTINIEYILKNNIEYKEFLETLNKQSDNFKITLAELESDILKEKELIINEKLFLSDDQYNKRVNEYNILLNEFDKKVQDSDIFLTSNLDKNKNILISKIIEITKNISIEKGYDLIFSENNYFISSNSVDISNLVIQILAENKLNLKIFKKEELF